jgi:hypothetical protein
MRRLWRNRFLLPGNTVAGVALVLLILALGLEPGGSFPGAVTAVVAAALVGFIFYRLATSRLLIENGNVHVRNPWGSVHVLAREVVAFGVGALGPFPRVAFVRLRGGKRVWIWSIQGRNPWWGTGPDSADRAVAELNRAFGLSDP